MTVRLQDWRKRNDLTQVDAAALLGVSQPYLSLLEKGVRPLTKALRSRMDTAVTLKSDDSTDDRFREQMSAMGYPPFAHLPSPRVKPNPDVLLLEVLSQHDADARVVEALPWLVRQYASKMNFPWLVRQAKLRNLQNRMGFLFQAAGVETPQFVAAAHELAPSRLLEEATLCWDSMPAATRNWVRAKRSPLAEYWNVVTTMRPVDSHDAA
ncbi:MAG: helix-turn-helix domain-containing protein [Acidobacteriota bacterium]